MFHHGVASGDPLADRVVLWTRATLADATDDIDIDWTLASDPDFRDIVAEGTEAAGPLHDHTVSVDVGGLTPDTYYWYRFSALQEASQVGRTRTLPGDDADHLRLAMVSCAKFNAGFFNAYARIADRDDLNFVLHLGDYIYEASQTPPATQTPGADIGRPFDPPHECLTLADYRRRYAQYRLDPDVQRLHATHPIVSLVDDHELADGAWRDGAADEQPGYPEWTVRRGDAFRARTEWLPVRLPDPSDPERVWRSISVGTLADLFLIDTRSRRDLPVPPPQMYDDSRSALGAEQRDWLLGEIDGSTAMWRILANPSVVGRTWDERLPDHVRPALTKLKLLNPEGTGPDFDQWDGYPAEREAIFGNLRSRGIENLVVLSGDVHVGIAIDLDEDGAAGERGVVASEFVTPSITSQNLDDKMGWTIRTESLAIERDVVNALPHWQWCDFDSHGYVVVDMTPERVRGDWWLLDTVLEPSATEHHGAAWMVERGRPGLVDAR